VLLVDSPDCGGTVTAEHYCGALETLWQVIYHQRPGLLHQGSTIFHSKARPHTANWTSEWLWCYSCEVIDHPADTNVKQAVT
jgi:hypothetical protein